MTSNEFISLVFVVLLVAAACLWLANWLRRRSGVPAGDIVYEDTSGAESEVLYSLKYGLRGKPDYLLEEDDGLIPVEVKSSNTPRNGRPYPSHRMQLAVYFLLVEDVLDADAPYGLIRYRDDTLRVENTNELREELLDVVAEMRDILQDGEAYRSHNSPRRCAGCSVAYACDQRLPMR
ncbi:MAG TPA: CRISPR-associated protein Cas4 [Blastocatellia bacterium]|nr:CRISPR-associated protein Cas4 [Blastocatellia bacterium]